MPRHWRFRITDILNAIERIGKFTSGVDLAKFKQNELVISATERQLEIIGEAVSNLPDNILERHSHIPWREIRGMRNTLAHEYHTIKIQILWKTVADELPPLKSAMQEIQRTETEE